MTPQQMVGQVRLRIDEPAEGTSPFWRNAELMYHLHNAQGYLYRKMVRARDNLFVTSTDINLVASQATYNLPLNARLGMAWSLIENRIASANPPLYVYDIRFQDHLLLEGPVGVSDPSDTDFSAVLQRDQLRITPQPGAAHTAGVRLWYNPMFGSMHEGTVAGIGSTTLTFDATPQFGLGATTVEAPDNRDDYYNAMDIYISSGTGAGQTRRISAYAGSTRVATIDTAWSTNPDTSSTYAVMCPIPEDFHNVVVLRGAWSAAAKRPRLRPPIETELIDEYQEAIGFITEDQTFRGGQVVPTDQGSY